MTGAAALWSSRRKTVLLFEGSRAVATGDVNAIEMTAVREYDTTAADDGSKIILFGGAADANVILNTVHILDVGSGQWTQGQSAPGPRTQMACAYHAGFFIAFGGTSSNNLTEDLYPSQPIVYDVNKDQWVDRYSPAGPAPAVPNDTNGSGSSASSPEEKTYMGIIVGAGVGAIAVMMVCAVVLGYMVQKRRRDRKAAERDARALAILSDGEDHYSHRRRTIHRKAAASTRNSNNNNGAMTAAEHYAAAQAAAELQAAHVRDTAIATDGSGGSGEKRATSWNSDTFSQAASENESSILLMNVAKARRLSDGPTFTAVAARSGGEGGVERLSLDPQTYYLQQQQKLQARLPELSLGDNSDNSSKVEVQATAPITAVGFLKTGLQQQQQQQFDRVRRSPHSMPDEAKTLLGSNSSSSVSSGGGNGSLTTTEAASGTEKAISFVRRDPSSSPGFSTQRGPHSLQ
ncbi:hypothetical protein BGZ96_008223 [Linnemannia gamsii]|uniref:Galactose oxidase n=1 Tax=Linnemannia gamsii TaxID=64522 RepID=A0ABQ7JZF9_9FUNG|nr:hypothetical protein BGZ96_008223 [Linnemannia gamsii]